MGVPRVASKREVGHDFQPPATRLLPERGPTMNSTHRNRGIASRRSVLAGAFGVLGWSAFDRAEAEAQERAGGDAPVGSRERIKITKLETLLVKPRWLFLKVHTDAGIVGLGEPIVEGRAADRRRGRQGNRALPAGQGPAPGGPPLAGDLPACILPRRPDPHQRLSGIDRPSGTSRGKHWAYRSTSCWAGRLATGFACMPMPGTPEQIKRGRELRLHGVQDKPGEEAAVALRRDAGRGALRRREIRRAAQGRR